MLIAQRRPSEKKVHFLHLLSTLANLSCCTRQHRFSCTFSTNASRRVMRRRANRNGYTVIDLIAARTRNETALQMVTTSPLPFPCSLFKSNALNSNEISFYMLFMALKVELNGTRTYLVASFCVLCRLRGDIKKKNQR